MYDARIAVQELAHSALIEINQSDALLLKPFTESGNGVRLAWYGRGQKAIAFYSSEVDIEVRGQRTCPQALQQLGIKK
jgi:hypothetical protein